MNEAATYRKQVVTLLQNRQYTRQSHVVVPQDKIRQTVSGKSVLNIRPTLSSKSETQFRLSPLTPALWLRRAQRELRGVGAGASAGVTDRR